MDISRLKSEFIDNMTDLLGEDVKNYLDHMEHGEPRRGLRVNTLKIAREEFERIFPYELVRSDFAQDGYYLPTKQSYGTHPYHHAGLFYMQEPSAMSVVSAISPYIGERVLDLCSAPGGKGTYLGALMQGKGILVLNEYVYNRANILKSNVERMGIRNATITNNSPKDFARLMPNYFDTIVVDAPCSGEGMFLKEENAAYNWNMANVKTSAIRQLEILSSAYEALAGGGYMIYSTCTLNRWENEGVVNEFLARHQDMSVIKVSDDLSSVTSDGVDNLPLARRIFPHRSTGEGHFLCLMHKGGEDSNNLKFDDTYTYVKDESEFQDMYANFSKAEHYGRLASYKDTYYLLPDVVPYFKGINIIRSGVEVCSMDKKRLTPSHNLVMALDKDDVANSIDLGADSIEMASYLKGNTLSMDTPFRGYGVLTCDGYPISIIKAIDGTIKNHYPKGLRNLK